MKSIAINVEELARQYGVRLLVYAELTNDYTLIIHGDSEDARWASVVSEPSEASESTRATCGCPDDCDKSHYYCRCTNSGHIALHMFGNDF